MTTKCVLLSSTFWLLVSCFCAIQTHGTKDFESECYDQNDNGVSYSGKISRPRCLNWKYVNSTYARYYEDHSYCRNPLPDEVSRPFCYTSINMDYELCDIPICDSDCYTNNGKLYYGSVTKHGCLKWSQVNYGPVNLHEDHNFCRNPVPDRLNTPWCFTNATTFAFQLCDVERCGLLKTCPVPTPSGNLTWTPVKSSYFSDDAVVFSCKGVISLSCAIISVCQENGEWAIDQPISEAKSELLQTTNPTPYDRNSSAKNELLRTTNPTPYENNASDHLTVREKICFKSDSWNNVYMNIIVSASFITNIACVFYLYRTRRKCMQQYELKSKTLEIEDKLPFER